MLQSLFDKYAAAGVDFILNGAVAGELHRRPRQSLPMGQVCLAKIQQQTSNCGPALTDLVFATLGLACCNNC